jgi:hypothetical protein
MSIGSVRIPEHEVFNDFMSRAKAKRKSATHFSGSKNLDATIGVLPYADLHGRVQAGQDLSAFLPNWYSGPVQVERVIYHGEIEVEISCTPGLLAALETALESRRSAPLGSSDSAATVKLRREAR